MYEYGLKNIPLELLSTCYIQAAQTHVNTTLKNNTWCMLI